MISAGPLALDCPDHSSVGDLAIWLGEMAYLHKRRGLPVYHSALGNGTILIHGGSNCGTL